MGMSASSDTLKRSLNFLTSQVTHIAVCSSNEPTSSTEAWSDYMLSNSSAAGVGAPGSTTNGWTVATSSHTGLAVSSSAQARHIALLQSTGAAGLLFVTTCTTRAVLATDTISIPSWNIRIADPTSS